MFDSEDYKVEKLDINDNFSEPEKEKTSKDISTIKKVIFILAGIGGLFVFSILASLIAKTLNLQTKEEFTGAANFITYAMLFVAIVAITNIDFKKVKNDFKNWLGFIVGVGFGIGLIMFSIIYTQIVNLFYESEINENEEALRSFITVYPITSLIFLGIIGPICEEFTYRIGLFGVLKKPKWLAYVIGTLVFALAHFSFTSENMINELINLPVYVFSGFMMCLVYDKFGLAGSLTAHTVNNIYSVSMVILFNFLNQ